MLLFLSGFIILSSKSCGPEADTNQAARLKAAQDSTRMALKNEFESEYLFEADLMVYGEKAKQKLLDFADYLTLYADKRIDTAFKQQVKEMLFRLFYRTDAPLSFSINPSEPVRGKNTLALLLESIDASPYYAIEFKVAETKTIEPLHLETAGQYTGQLRGRVTIRGISGNDTILLNNAMHTVRIVTTRTSKQFGTGTPRMVWQVFLDKTETDYTIAP